MAAAIDRVRAGRAPARNVRIDQYDVKQAIADKVAGRDRRIGEFHRVLDYHGFRYYEAREVDRRFGFCVDYVRDLREIGEFLQFEIPHVEGEWRRLAAPRHTFSTSDIVTLFESPYAFDLWMRAELLKHARKARVLRARG